MPVSSGLGAQGGEGFMTGRGPYGGEPGQTPPPPAPPLAPGYAPPAPPPRKRNVGAVVLVVIAVLLCVTAACIGTVTYSVLSSGAKTRDAVRQAESHLDAATKELEAATQSLDEYLNGRDAGAEAAVGSRLRATRDEIAAARATIEALPDSEGKSLYLSALEEANKAVESVEQLLGTVGVIIDLSEQVKRGGADVEAGNKALNAAIKAGNRRDYSTMKTQARLASRKYASGARIFSDAHEAEPSAGLDKVVDYANLRKKQADLIAKMADEGRAGRTSSYNKLVDQQAALSDKAEMAGTPDIVSDPEWGRKRVELQQSAFEGAADRADELRARALKAFGITD